MKPSAVFIMSKFWILPVALALIAVVPVLVKEQPFIDYLGTEVGFREIDMHEDNALYLQLGATKECQVLLEVQDKNANPIHFEKIQCEILNGDELYPSEQIDKKGYVLISGRHENANGRRKNIPFSWDSPSVLRVLCGKSTGPVKLVSWQVHPKGAFPDSPLHVTRRVVWMVILLAATFLAALFAQWKSKDASEQQVRRLINLVAHPNPQELSVMREMLEARLFKGSHDPVGAIAASKWPPTCLAQAQKVRLWNTAKSAMRGLMSGYILDNHALTYHLQLL